MSNGECALDPRRRDELVRLFENLVENRSNTARPASASISSSRPAHPPTASRSASRRADYGPGSRGTSAAADGAVLSRRRHREPRPSEPGLAWRWSAHLNPTAAVTIDSAPGAGATFTVHCPRGKPPTRKAVSFPGLRCHFIVIGDIQQ